MRKTEIVRPEQGGDVFVLVADELNVAVGRDEEDSANVRVLVTDGVDELFVLRFDSDTRIMVEAAKLAPNGEEYGSLTWNSNE